MPGGVGNIKDIYALSPSQDGILFHHQLATKGDPYLNSLQLAFSDRALLDRYIQAVQQVVDRQDTLRTIFFWKGLSTPVQVVLRKASLHVSELALDPGEGPITEQLAQRFDHRHCRISLVEAPLMHVVIAHDPQHSRWVVHQLLHHIIQDNSSVAIMQAEVQAFLEDRGQTLPAAVPYRNLVAQSRLDVSQEEHTRFFRRKLAGLSEPTLPFGLAEVHRDGSGVTEAQRVVSRSLAQRLAHQSKRLGVSHASFCHLAWAQVLARISGQSSVVFGTVVFGRMHGRADASRAMGLFINTLPLRLDLGHMDVEQSVHATQNELAELLAHEHASLPLAQRCSAIPVGTPLFSALLNYRHSTHPQPDQLDGVGAAIQLLGMQERTNYPLGMAVDDFGEGLQLTAQVAVPWDPDRVCGYMQACLESLADALEHRPHTPVSNLEVLPEEERKLLLKTWNAMSSAYPDDICIHRLFERQVAQSAEATALAFEDEQLSYAELNKRANCLAHRLIELGVTPDSRVAICMHRSIGLVVGLLAILKAGGAYVPVDPTYPHERQMHILRDAAPSILLADQAGLDALGDEAVADLTVIDPNTSVGHDEENPLVPGLTSRHLAYVIYTSGSTGLPKGALNEHRALSNRLDWMQKAYGLSAVDRVLQKTPYSFDVSVWEFFWPLLNGAMLVLAAPEIHKDPDKLLETISRQRVSVLHFVPSMLSAFLQHAAGAATPAALRQIMCSGEALPLSTVQLCRSVFPDVALHNLYGPTEAAIDVTAWTCPKDFAGDLIPIGRPIANTQIYLLDEQRKPVPLGAAGELYIGGVGVARGYLNRPELTAERFVADPFTDDADARMYRTGDLARYLPDGDIIYLGRNDHQVKVRGFRIELGEIEARLCEHHKVVEAVVTAREDGSGEKRLIAYLTRTDTSPDPNLASVLREFLLDRLPDYMVPAAFVQMDVFPLTPNGKLDRKALPAPDGDSFARRAYEAPFGPIETSLAKLWSEQLGIQDISRNDSFIELGGSSLSAMRLMNRIHDEFGKRMSLGPILTSPSLAAMAARLLVDGENDGDIVIPMQPEGDGIPIFAVPGAGGGVLVFRELAKALGEDQPFYGIQTIGLDGTQEPPPTVEETARLNIAAMKSVRPSGPYRLLGHSYGGVVVFEMARQLQAIGDEVAGLLLLDTRLRPPQEMENRTLLADICTLLTTVNRLQVRLDMSDWEGWSDEECSHSAFTFLSQNGLAIDYEQFCTFYRVCKAHIQCYQKYACVPLAQPTKGILIRALRHLESIAMIHSVEQVDDDPDHGWSKWLKAPVAIHDVDANHLGLLEPDYVAQYVEALKG